MKILYLKRLSGKFFLQLEIDIKEVEEFWLTFFMMTTNMEDYYLEQNEEEVREVFRDTMEVQFEHDMYNESFSNQLESDDDERDTLQQRIKWWRPVVDRGGPIPKDVYDYTLDEFFMLYRKAIDPELQDFVEALRDYNIKTSRKAKCNY